jgi:uncharacterized protein with von Willebrand factor type A (vWA) domain
MFEPFVYLLKSYGLKVSLNEWMILMEALYQGLGHSSLTGFYRLCKAVLVKSEAEIDKFDMAFIAYFRGIEHPDQLNEVFWKWLSEEIKVKDIDEKSMLDDYLLELEELQKRFEERKKEQKERHDGGNYWIGTGGTSTMGHSGYHERGIRVGGEGRYKTAVQIAGERNFIDFREDHVLSIRSFQMAFRKLRQYAANTDSERSELDIDETVKQTGDHAGLLSLEWKKPRRNTVKLIILFDSDGSMLPYNRLCSRLFQSISKSNHFQDLKIYYFHNCVYEHLYTSPACRNGEWIDTEWMLKNLNRDYRLIIVGDAAMAASELKSKGGNAVLGLYNEIPGIAWLNRLRKHYVKSIWFNPVPEGKWQTVYGNQTVQIIREIFPMYGLTLNGLESGIKKLMVSR